jgi:hypothetical protein
MSLAIRAFAPEPLFTRRAHRQNMARAAKAFSAISLGAAFVLTTGEAGAQNSRASAEEGFSPINGTPLGFNDDGDLIVLLADGKETVIPRGEYGLVGDQIMVSDMIEGVEVAQNGYIPPTSGVPVYGSPGPFGLGFASWAIPLGLAAVGVIAYLYISRSNNEAPAFGAASYSGDIDEDETGTILTVAAVDAEGDTFAYSLSGVDSSFFSISSAGAITFDDEPNFEAPGDSDRDSEYVFTATATDEHGEASSVTITVDVDDVADDPATTSSTTVTGTAAANDIANTAEVLDVDMLGGNDSAILSGGIAASGTVDMGAGADYLQILTAGAAGPGVEIDLGTGNDELELDFDLGANVVTIDLGSGNDIIDIDTAQTAATHVIENFGSGDLLDLGSLGITGALDITLHASLAAATSAITTAAGSEVAVALHDNGTDIDMYIDTDDNGTHDMVLTFDSVSSISASQVDL